MIKKYKYVFIALAFVSLYILHFVVMGKGADLRSAATFI